MTQPAVLHAWYTTSVPLWAPVCAGVGLLLVLTAFAIDWKRGRL